MLPNPYTPGRTPRHLAGRSHELQAIRDHVAPILAYGESSGPQLVVHGPRGIGKTSLVAAAAADAAEQGFVVAWTSCTRKQPFLADLAHSIDRALAASDLTPPAKWSTTMKRVAVEVSVPTVAKVTASVHRERQDPVPAQGAVSAVEDLLSQAAHLAAGDHPGRRGVGILVAIDELHAGGVADLAVLLNALQNLSHDRRQNPLALIGAGLPSVRGVLTSAATFGERSRWMGLDNLTDADLTDALVAPADELGVRWSPAAVAHALQVAQRYPHFVQIMGSAAWREAEPVNGSTIELIHARAGSAIGRREIEDLYRARWGSVTHTERRVIAAMATLGGERSVARRDVEEAVGGDISAYRARLLDKAIVEDVDRGLLRFTLPGFAAFVLAETDRPG